MDVRREHDCCTCSGSYLKPPGINMHSCSTVGRQKVRRPSPQICQTAFGADFTTSFVVHPFLRPVAARVPGRAVQRSSLQSLQSSSDLQDPSIVRWRLRLTCVRARRLRSAGLLDELLSFPSPRPHNHSSRLCIAPQQSRRQTLRIESRSSPRPTLDKLSPLSVDINSLSTRLTGELSMLRSQIQASFLVAGSIVAVLGLAASVAGNASAIPAGYYQFGQAVFQVFLVGLAINLLRATWLFVETRQWKTRREGKAVGAT